MISYDDLPVTADGQHHAWQVFPGDERGSLARLTDAVVRGAVAEVRTGDRIAPAGIVARGVLVDVPRHWAAAGREWSPHDRYEITTDDVETALAAQGTRVRTGDVLLVRTGWVGWYLSLDASGRKELGGTMTGALPAPGLCQGEDFARWLWNHGAAAVAADNPALEALPVPKGSGFLHRYLMPLPGIPIGELWALDDLAAACARHGRWTFLLVSVPLNIPQGVGSPNNAVAVF